MGVGAAGMPSSSEGENKTMTTKPPSGHKRRRTRTYTRSPLGVVAYYRLDTGGRKVGGVQALSDPWGECDLTGWRDPTGGGGGGGGASRAD